MKNIVMGMIALGFMVTLYSAQDKARVRDAISQVESDVINPYIKHSQFVDLSISSIGQDLYESYDLVNSFWNKLASHAKSSQSAEEIAQETLHIITEYKKDEERTNSIVVSKPVKKLEGICIDIIRK
jgi:hypothetical protein